MQNYFIDKEGVAFEDPKNNNDFVEIISDRGAKIGETIFNKKEMDSVLDIEKRFEKLKVALNKIVIGQNRIDAITGEGWQAYLSTIEDLSWQLDKLEILLDEKYSVEQRREIEYIDLRFEKIYVSHKSEKPTKE
jgi:hypothetical protein